MMRTRTLALTRDWMTHQMVFDERVLQETRVGSGAPVRRVASATRGPMAVPGATPLGGNACLDVSDEDSI